MAVDGVRSTIPTETCMNEHSKQSVPPFKWHFAGRPIDETTLNAGWVWISIPEVTS